MDTQDLPGRWNNSGPPVDYPGEWWEQRRLKYNIGLVIAGFFAFIATLGVLASPLESLPETDFSLFTVAIQVILYLIYMGLANIFYFLGRIAEKVTRPAQLDSFRNQTFTAGCVFSYALPFLVPISLLVISINWGNS